jgi:hypothetical protein
MVIHRHQHALHAMCSWRTTAARTALWSGRGAIRALGSGPMAPRYVSLAALSSSA